MTPSLPSLPGILSDITIRDLAHNHGMIEPFEEAQKRDGVISYGLSSFGYDARVADEFKIFTNVDSSIIDPKDFDPQCFVDRKTDVCIIPPNSFVLGRTLEKFRIPRDVLVVCLGKSTYARCFSGETRVALANGTSVTFSDMEKRSNDGEEFYGYGINDNGMVVVTKLIAPRLVARGERLQRVDLDDGSYVECTPDHEFITRNGELKRADQLSSGQSLMPLYRYECRGREVLYHPGNETMEATYRLSDAYNLRNGAYAIQADTHRHHKDEDKRNDYPTNIERMDAAEHTRHHNDEFYGDGFDAVAHSMAIIQSLNVKKTDPEWVQRYADAQSDRATAFWNDPDHQETRDVMAKALSEKWKDPDFRQRQNNSRTAFWRSEDGQNVLARRKMPKRLEITPKQVADALGSAGTVVGAAKILGTSKQYLYREHRTTVFAHSESKSATLNHKVVQVKEIDGSHDVYCLTSPETGNFALEAGVFVKNCGIIVNVTPLEPEWEGYVTLEFSNTTPLPAKLYANEGCCQLLFFRGDREPETSYADRAGKYMGQTGVVVPRL